MFFYCNLKSDDEVKKVKFFPIQDEVQAATKPTLCLVSRIVPGANQTPLYLHPEQRVAGHPDYNFSVPI